MNNAEHRNLPTPLQHGSSGDVAAPLRENGGVAPAYWGKLARILLLTSLASPLRLAEWIRYGRQVAQTQIDPQPLFILGFARSGTTHLHNLLQRDPQYGTVSTFQAIVPTFFLIGRGWLKRQMAKSLPDTRPGDNVRVSLMHPLKKKWRSAIPARFPLSIICRSRSGHACTGINTSPCRD